MAGLRAWPQDRPASRRAKAGEAVARIPSWCVGNVGCQPSSAVALRWQSLPPWPVPDQGTACVGGGGRPAGGCEPPAGPADLLRI